MGEKPQYVNREDLFPDANMEVGPDESLDIEEVEIDITQILKLEEHTPNKQPLRNIRKPRYSSTQKFNYHY